MYGVMADDLTLVSVAHQKDRSISVSSLHDVAPQSAPGEIPSVQDCRTKMTYISTLNRYVTELGKTIFSHHGRTHYSALKRSTQKGLMLLLYI
jgi:hypothetical protein